jgi:hypothetical protein
LKWIFIYYSEESRYLKSRNVTRFRHCLPTCLYNPHNASFSSYRNTTRGDLASVSEEGGILYQAVLISDTQTHTRDKQQQLDPSTYAHVTRRHGKGSVGPMQGQLGWYSDWQLLDDRGVAVPVGSRIFCSPRPSDWLWGPPGLPSNAYRTLFPRE